MYSRSPGSLGTFPLCDLPQDRCLATTSMMVQNIFHRIPYAVYGNQEIVCADRPVNGLFQFREKAHTIKACYPGDYHLRTQSQSACTISYEHTIRSPSRGRTCGWQGTFNTPSNMGCIYEHYFRGVLLGGSVRGGAGRDRQSQGLRLLDSYCVVGACQCSERRYHTQRYADRQQRGVRG